MSQRAASISSPRCAARLAVAALLSLAAAACGSTQSVRYGASVASYTDGDYGRVHDRWTRAVRGNRGVSHGFETSLDAHVTLMSDDFRAAYLAKVTAMRAYTPEQRAVLAAELAQDGASYLELIVELTAARWEWLELASRTSVWTLTLTDDKGHQLGGPDVLQMEDKPAALEELFPPVTPFSRHWRVRFKRKLPDGGQLAGPGTRSITLRFAGPLGNETVTW